jgi:phosphomannomutase
MMKIKLTDLRVETGVGFGTSGIRDLVTKLTDKTVYLYAKAFIGHLRNIGDLENKTVAVAGDLRKSSPRIMATVVKAIQDEGLTAINCGHIPTPAVTYFGLIKKVPTIMVTGSHIPDDRNGVKYQLSTKEILKSDEEAITGGVVEYEETIFDTQGMFVRPIDLPEETKGGYEIYVKRCVDKFGKDFLKDKRIGIWGHSAVGRELYADLFTRLGATTEKIEYSYDVFVPVDTDAVNEELIVKMKMWDEKYNLDYIMATDGDGDRPLLTDENGDQIRSELLPLLAAKYLGAEVVAITLTSCTVAERTGWFKKVVRTKVGSPHIVGAMDDFEKEGFKKVMGYELNGGFFMDELKTRDALMPILGTIALAKKMNKTVAELILELPQRFTYSLSIKGTPTELSLKIIDEWKKYKNDIEVEFGKIKNIDLLDGLRLTFENDDIVHFRPSKNAPEFRNYTESETYGKARMLSEKAINLIQKWTK